VRKRSIAVMPLVVSSTMMRRWFCVGVAGDQPLVGEHR
jgi:hypothetical protein